MWFAVVFLVIEILACECSDSAADRAFGFTNFKIKLKSGHGVIDRTVEENEKENFIIDDDFPRVPGGPTKFDPLRQVKIPMVFILNERFENPKFVSRQPKRKKITNNVLPITNEIEDKPRDKAPKRKNLKQKLNELKSSGNHANILNTNFKFAYLKRMKQKLQSQSNQNRLPKTLKSKKSPRRRLVKVKRVRKKI